MNLGELREMLDEFPDDYKVMIDISDTDPDDRYAVYFDITDVDDNSVQNTVYIVAE